MSPVVEGEHDQAHERHHGVGRLCDGRLDDGAGGRPVVGGGSSSVAAALESGRRDDRRQRADRGDDDGGAQRVVVGPASVPDDRSQEHVAESHGRPVGRARDKTASDGLLSLFAGEAPTCRVCSR